MVRGLGARTRALGALLARWIRALLRGVGRAIAGVAQVLYGGARSESRRRRAVWIAIAALLILGPLAFNLARAPGFAASVQLFPVRVPGYPASFEPAYYRALLMDRVLRAQMRINVGALPADLEQVSIEPGPRRDSLRLTVRSSTPLRAQRLVNALAPQVAGATQRQVAKTVRTDIARTRARLRTRLSRDERSAERRRLRRLERLTPLPPTRVQPGASAPRPPLDRWADRLVNDLPGDFKGRPSPAWAAAAGLLVAATLWATCLVLIPPRRLPDADLPQPD
jgi:hypothetical protein